MENRIISSGSGMCKLVDLHGQRMAFVYWNNLLESWSESAEKWCFQAFLVSGKDFIDGKCSSEEILFN